MQHIPLRTIFEERELVSIALSQQAILPLTKRQVIRRRERLRTTRDLNQLSANHAPAGMSHIFSDYIGRSCPMLFFSHFYVFICNAWLSERHVIYVWHLFFNHLFNCYIPGCVTVYALGLFYFFLGCPTLALPVAGRQQLQLVWEIVPEFEWDLSSWEMFVETYFSSDPDWISVSLVMVFSCERGNSGCLL